MNENYEGLLSLLTSRIGLLTSILLYEAAKKAEKPKRRKKR